MSFNIKNWYEDENGATVIQYGLIATLVGTGIIGSVTIMGGELGGTMTYIARVLNLGADGQLFDNGEGDFTYSDAGVITRRGGGDLWIQTVGLDGWDLGGIGQAGSSYLTAMPAYMRQVMGGMVRYGGESRRLVYC